jgi:hypothetical protein
VNTCASASVSVGSVPCGAGAEVADADVADVAGADAEDTGAEPVGDVAAVPFGPEAAPTKTNGQHTIATPANQARGGQAQGNPRRIEQRGMTRGGGDNYYTRFKPGTREIAAIQGLKSRPKPSEK